MPQKQLNMKEYSSLQISAISLLLSLVPISEADHLRAIKQRGELLHYQIFLKFLILDQRNGNIFFLLHVLSSPK